MRKQIDVSTLGGRIKYKRTESGMTQAEGKSEAESVDGPRQELINQTTKLWRI